MHYLHPAQVSVLVMVRALLVRGHLVGTCKFHRDPYAYFLQMQEHKYILPSTRLNVKQLL
jgi:hypothetical protein